MVRVQYLPEGLLSKIPPSFFANPVASPFSKEMAKPYPDLWHPDGKIIDFDEELLRSLLKEGIERHGHNQNELDSWLAPRVHAVIRVPRRIAADRLFWAWVAIEYGRDYIRHRFAAIGGTEVKQLRFTSTHLRNGISRLWWSAELARDGRDYGPVALALRAVRVAQFALELRYSWYRPAAIAFARICKERGLSDEQMQALSVRLNAYLGTRPVELVGLDEGGTEEYDHDWWTASPPSKEALFSKTIDGPDDGHASPDAIKALVAWFDEVLAQLKPIPSTTPVA